MLTFEAEKHENIVAFVLFAVLPGGRACTLARSRCPSVPIGRTLRPVCGACDAAGAVRGRSRVVGVERGGEGVLQQ